MKKKIILIVGVSMAVGLLISTSALAQWAPNGNNIYNTNSGFVGIGTTTPALQLHLLSTGTALNDGADIQLEGAYSGTDKNIGIILIKNSTTNDLFYTGLRTWNGGQREFIMSGYDAATNTWGEFMYFNYTSKKYMIQNGISDVEFKNNGNTYFKNTGAVGIGVTTIPTGVKLAVNGKVNCKEVEVTLSGWSDFVFNNNYKLKSLYEVESFINENKHLPDVPSETEVLQKGNNLGQMDALLLQKIEELTLYVIQLKKENDALKEKFDQMK